MARIVRTSPFPSFPDQIAEGTLVITLGPVAPRAWRAFRRWKPDGYLATATGVLVLVGLDQWLAAAACSTIVAVWIAVRRA